MSGLTPFWWDVGATQDYLTEVSANGLTQGGFGGYLQFIGAQLAQDLIDFSGASSVAASAQNSGAASGSPCHQGAAWGYGTLTAATILLSALPGGGQVAQKGETIILGRFLNMVKLEELALQYGGKILKGKVPIGEVWNYVRGEIDSADKLVMYMKDVHPPLPGQPPSMAWREYEHIMQNPELRSRLTRVYP